MSTEISVREFRRRRSADCDRIRRQAVEVLAQAPYGMKTSLLTEKLNLAGQERTVAQLMNGCEDVFRANRQKKEGRWVHKRWVNNVALWLERDPQDLLRR